MKFSFVLLFLTFQLIAEARDKADCSSIQLPLAQIGPVRNQGVSGLCFAYEGADLLSYKMGFRVSALDVALYSLKVSSLNKMSEVYANGGETESAIEAGRIEGFCSEQMMPSDEDQVDFSAEPHAKIHDGLIQLESSNWQEVQTFELAQNIFPYLRASDFYKAAEVKDHKTRFHYLQKISCFKRTTLAKMNFVNKSLQKKSSVTSLIRIMDRQLENSNLVGIGFHSNDLYIVQEPEDDSHGTTIVARRWNEKQNSCEYLMRDNFGEQCELYKPGLACEKGYIWLDEAFFVKNLTEVEYIQ